MPDLLGPNPCEGCVGTEGQCAAYGRGFEAEVCPLYAAYAARRDLLERLKGEGEDMSLCNGRDWEVICEELADRYVLQKGHLVFIPEAQE